MTATYDDTNIFARILRGEIPCTRLLETPHSLAFPDIRAQAPVHVLVIPRGRYVTYEDFARDAPEAEIIDFTRALAEVCRMSGVGAAVSGHGFRMISNAGRDGMQEVPHMHVHVLGGRLLGRLLDPA